jgi:enoyl-CoA hydratase/carnithine racemase
LAFECLTYEQKGGTCYLTLNRPEKLNALNAQLMGELRESLKIIELDPEIRVVILTGAGRAFSAGIRSRQRLRRGSASGRRAGCSPEAPTEPHRHVHDGLEPQQAGYRRCKRFRLGRGL